MYGYNVVEKLDFEIVNVQISDNYLKNGKIRLSDYFTIKDVLTESDIIADTISKMKCKENIDDEYNERFSHSYSIDGILELLVSDLSAYSVLYKVPPIKISNVEWELLFYELGKYYHNRDIDGFFIEDITYLNKMAISKAMVYEDDAISLETYIWSLRYLESNIITEGNLEDIASQLSTVFGIDALSLIKNETGKIGCLNKSFDFHVSSKDEIIKTLVNNGYEIEDSNPINKDDSSTCDKPKQKVVKFSDYANSKK